MCYLFLAALLLYPACPKDPPNAEPSPPPQTSVPESVLIVDKASHYELTIDYGSGLSPRDMGARLGTAILERMPDYRALADSYIRDAIALEAGSDPDERSARYGTAISRLGDISIPREYADEIEGLASTLCDAEANALADGKLSRDELWLLELILDVGKSCQCSAVSVFGDASETGRTITGRVLDWYGGENAQLPRMQAVTTIRNGDRSVVLVGYLGLLSGITVASDNGLFAAILESPSSGSPTTLGKRSYSMDLRYAMEYFSTVREAASYMASNHYVTGHLVFLSDANGSAVLENDLNGNKGLRTSESPLRPGIAWGIPNAIGCVNSFALEGNYDNHSGRPANTARWATLVASLGAAGPRASSDEVVGIVSSFSGQTPGRQSDGDLYNETTQQIVVIEPGAAEMRVFFKPRDGSLPAVPAFETVRISF